MNSERRIRVTKNRLSITSYLWIISQHMRANRAVARRWTRLSRAPELFRGEQRIHRSGAESFQIESDELESQSFENCRELIGDCRIQCSLQFLPCNLDAHNVAMMPHPELPETESANRIFAAFDYFQRLARHRTSVLDTRRKAGRGRLVPDAQTSLPRQIADFVFREAGLQ